MSHAWFYDQYAILPATNVILTGPALITKDNVATVQLAVVLVTHNVTHAMTVGDHFAVLIHGMKADDFAKGERTWSEITDLMAGGEAMAELEAELAQLSGVGQPTNNTDESFAR